MARFAVVTAKPELAIYRELERVAVELGHTALIVDALRAVARATPAAVLLDEQELDACGLTAQLPRVGNWRPDSTLAVVAALQAAGVAPLNQPAAIRRGRDHWRTASALAATGLPHPETVAGAEPETLAAAAVAACGLPCVVKQRHSRQGVGVIRCFTRAELDAVLDSLWRLGDDVVVQRFCPPGGISRRALVLRGRVLGAVEHRAGAGEFRSNAARGGRVESVGLEPDQEVLATAAADAVGLGFAGVDLLPDGDRWVIGEVNPTPGWRHFQAASSIRVAEALVRALTQQP